MRVSERYSGTFSFSPIIKTGMLELLLHTTSETRKLFEVPKKFESKLKDLVVYLNGRPVTKTIRKTVRIPTVTQETKRLRKTVQNMKKLMDWKAVK